MIAVPLLLLWNRIGLNDFGWTYDAARRIADGELQYRDFYSNQPPLPYLLAGLARKLFGDLYIVRQIHLQFWWAASIFSAAWLSLALGQTARTAVLSAGLAAFSHLACHMQHEHNFMATTFVAIAVGVLYRALTNPDRPQLVPHVVAGGLLAVACFAKQNIGIFTAGGLGATVVLLQFLRRDTRKDWKPFLSYCASGGIVGAALALPFVMAVGVPTFLQGFLFDASQGKGGILITLGRAVPRINLTIEAGIRKPIEISLTVVVVLLLARFFFVLKRASPETTKSFMNWSIWAITGATVILSLALGWMSLQHNDGMRVMVDELNIQNNPWFILVTQVTYIGFGLLAGVGFWASWKQRDPRTIILSIVLTIGMLGHGSSSLNYPLITAALVWPIAISLATRLLEDRTPTGVLVAQLLLLVFNCFFLHSASYFGYYNVIDMPRDTKLREMRGPVAYAELVHLISERIAPIVRGRSTVWVANPFPYEAFEAVPAKNFTAYCPFTHVPRLEPALLETWAQHPPEFFVLADHYSLPATSNFQRETLLPWVQSHFDLRCAVPDCPLEVWQKKPTQ